MAAENNPEESKPDHQSTSSSKGNGLLLYYHAYSFYSQKVVMALHEKKLPFKTHSINITKGEQYEPWFLQINPRGEVPVLRDGVKIIPDSARILEYLEDNFSNGGSRLIPNDQGPQLKSKVTRFRNIIDPLPAGIITMGSFFHPEFTLNPKLPFIQPVRKILMNAENNSSKSLREKAQEQTEKIKETLLQKSRSQEIKHQRIISKDEYLKVLDQIDFVLNQVEKELNSHNEEKKEWWLCSDRFTAADISLTILLDRLYRLGLSNYFWDTKRPNIRQYYLRVQERDSFKKTIPSTLFHIQTFLNLQNPLMLGFGVITTLALIVGGICFYRRMKIR